MQLKHLQTLLQPVVCLYDEHGEKQDKFATKPADSTKGSKNYVVRALAWSPDSCKLAVAQSDNIVFVYKLSSAPEKASEWGEKKSIVNKFLQHEPVTCMVWPTAQPNYVVIGLADGKVRIGSLKNNKTQTLYPTGSYVCAMACSPDGNAFVTGHADGKIYQFFFDDGSGQQSQSTLVKHPCAPRALVWGQNVMACGADKRLIVYDDRGSVLQNFDYGQTEGEREPSSAASSPSGQSAVFGSYDRLRVYNFNVRRGIWEEKPPKNIENMYTITALGWKHDGTRLSVGTLCGGIELFDCALKRTIFKGKFEFTYVGPSQVIVKKLATGTRIVLKSFYHYEIEKVNVLGNDQFLVAHTTDTLLLGDLASCRLSEIPWRGSGNEKFFFENPTVCMIFNAGELTLVEYGVNEILGSVRTEHMNPHLISVRINERLRRGEGDVKRVAYLIDLKTVAILDMVDGSSLTTINHDAKVDWLELNETGRKLLFRDRRRRLHLYDLATQERITILNYCSYVQWVPGSDVIVAQNRQNLCIWYNIEAPERVTTLGIKGDVEDIERVDGHTEVIVDEGVNKASYALDEGLIEFGTAVDDGDYVRACNFLETLEMTPESEAMWKTLGELSLENDELYIAERCFAALGNVAKARYLHKVNELARKEEEYHPGEGYERPAVRAKLATLNKHFKLAESLLLEQGQTDEAIKMYKTLHKWDDAIAVAHAKNHPDVEDLQAGYNKWLADTAQDEKAGDLRECEGDYTGALNLYMKAGLPARAAQLVTQHEELSRSADIIERVASALLNAGLEAKAGELFELARMNQRALDAYRKGYAFRKAVELCREAFPAEVVPQEEAWGDYLVSQKQMDAAINHYIEAGASEKAIDAAIASRQWSKAAQVVEVLEEAVAGRYYEIIADHYAEIREFQVAEKYYVSAGTARKAIDMYIRVSEWEAAHSLAQEHMQREDVIELYVAQAEALELRNKIKDAEKLYLQVNEPDRAINMYKKATRYDDMIRLVKRHHPDLLSQTHQHLAKELENDSHFMQAEQYYVAAEDWKSAVNMYRGRDMWDDAHRVAKAHGGQTAAQQVGYLWARNLGGDSAVKLLTKFGMIEAAIDFACEAQNEESFAFAFELSRSACKSKLEHIHMKYAMFFEDHGKFKEAEEEFIKAARPREAVLMHVHSQDWDSAQRVAENHDPSSVADVLVGQARVAFASREFQKGETFLLRADKPELAIKYYREANMWADVMRLAKEYLPNKLDEYTEQYEAAKRVGGPGVSESERSVAARQDARQLEAAGNYDQAVTAYLALTPGSNPDVDFLEECWEKAVELATKHVPARLSQVVRTASQRLSDAGRHDAAADLYMGCEMTREAIDTCIAGNRWDRARKYAAEYLPDYASSVEQQYVASLRNGGGEREARTLMNVDASAGLDLYAQRGEWETCLRQAETEGPGMVVKYAALYATSLLRDARPIQAVDVFAKYGAPQTTANYNIYRRMVLDMLAHRGEVPYKKWANLRNMLLQLTVEMRRSEDSSLQEFERFTLIVHYTAMRSACSGIAALNEISCKVSISLLRYTDLVPADKAFHCAGEACRKVGWENMGFVFLNRYLDLCEAIEDGDLSGLDNTDFAGTDIPFEIPLPEQQFLNESIREEIREYVLAVSMDQKVEQTLDVDARGMFVGSLKTDGSSKTYDPCIVTGYPVLTAPVEFGGRSANKEDWNRFIMATKSTNGDNLQDVMKFLAAWCGASESSAAYSFR